MASNTDFVQYIIDQCSGAGEIAVKKMMGDYCNYCDGILFGLICDNNLYIKITDAGEAVLDNAIAPNIVCSQDLRAFFEQYLGKSFRFKVEFQNWLRENAGLTFRDAVEAYPLLASHRMQE